MLLSRFILYIAISVFSSSLAAIELVRLDQHATQDVQSQILVYITEGCNICQQQIDNLRECFSSKDIALLLGGDSEEKLRSYVRRKKFAYQTYHLSLLAKSDLEIGDISPQILFYKNNKIANRLTGLQTCESIKMAFKADSSILQK